MPNQYVNKVVQRNGNTLIDISDTTAVASDVASGKYFYLATGEKVEGTGSSGGSVTWEILSDQNITIVADNPNPSYFIFTFTDPLQENETYRITWGNGGTVYTCNTKADPIGATYDGYLLGNFHVYDATAVDTGEPFLLYRRSATQMVGLTNQSAGSWHIKIERQQSGTNQDYEDALTAFGVQSNLASGITALTTYANEITGESDTTLSDAVRSLADGYSGTIYFTSTGLMYTANYESPAANQTTQLSYCPNLETVYAPNATTCGQYAGGRDCAALKSVHFPKCAVYPQYFIRQQDNTYNKLESVTVGSIGYPVTSLAQRWRYGSHAQTLTVTIYVNAETLADIPTGVSRYAAGDNAYAPSGSVVNVVYRNSNTGDIISS